MLSALQKAACEATWRALMQRGEDKTGLGLDKTHPRPLLRQRIMDFAYTAPQSHLVALTLPELQQHGPLPAGYGNKWGARPLLDSPPPTDAAP